MVSILASGPRDRVQFNDAIEICNREPFATLEDAAQKYIDTLYAHYKDSIVLARVFATVPFENLPDANKKFVKALAAAKGVVPLLNDKTVVLSLIASRGVSLDWNDRRSSKGHVGIPLVSADFIELIPMMSRLLKSLGVSLDWISSGDTNIISKTLSNMAGLFHVPDAQSALDDRGRKIITAEDFVGKYGVRTVFGFGGGYMMNLTNVVFIIFTRESIGEEKLKPFMTLVNKLKAVTMSVVNSGKIFKP